MAGFDFTIANNILKRIYDSKDTVSQIQDQAPYWKSKKRIPAELGDALYSSIQTGRNQAIGIRNSGSNDNQALPTPSAPSFDDPAWNTVRIYGRINVTGKALNRTMNSKRSFAAGISQRTADLDKAWVRDMEFRSLNGSTDTGNKTGCRGVLDAATAYVNGSAVTFTLRVNDSGNRRWKRCIGIFPNIKLDVYDSTWSKVAEITVSTVDKVNNQFVGTLSAPLAADGSVDTYYLFREGDFNQDVYGLLDLADDGTLTTALAGVTTGGIWKGTVLANSGTLRPLTTDILDDIILTSEEEDDEVQGELWMNWKVYKKLLALHQRNIILNKEMGDSKVKANLGGVIEAYDRSAVKKSSLAQAHYIYGIKGTDVVVLEQEAYHPIAIDGPDGSRGFWLKLEGYDAFEATFVQEWQHKLHRRNLHVLGADIEE